MARHRYKQEAVPGIPGAQPNEYSPKGLELAGPTQGRLPLDGSFLGPLFDTTTTTTTTTPRREQ
jgi:hypothetical protein